MTAVVKVWLAHALFHIHGVTTYWYSPSWNEWGVSKDIIKLKSTFPSASSSEWPRARRWPRSMFSRVCHLQCFLISELFQAGMNVCHTQEQWIFRLWVFYVAICQLILTFVSNKFNYVKMVPKRLKNSTFCKFFHNATCKYWNDALGHHNVIWIFWDSYGCRNQNFY